MKRLALTTMSVLSVCAVALAQPAKLPPGLPATRPASQPAPTPAEPEVRSFELTPVAPPTPALKYHLLFTAAERVPGNAALAYLDAAFLLAPDSNEKAERALDALGAKDAKAFAAAADSIDLQTMLDELDLAGRREQCDWEVPVRERGVLTLLPHLQPLTHGVAKVLRVRATRQVEQGKVDEALATLRLGYELSEKIGMEPVNVSAMVSVGQFAWMNEPLSQLMSRPESPNLYWALSEMPRRYPILRRSWDAEYGWPYMCMPTLARARAGETLTAAEWRKAMYDEVAPFYAQYENYAAVGMRSHPDPIKDASPDVLRQAREHYAAAAHVTPQQAEGAEPAVVLGGFYFHQFTTLHDDIFKLRGLAYPELVPRTRQTAERLETMMKEQPGNPFLQAVPAMNRAVGRVAVADRQLAALTAVEAIRSFAAANGGKLPERLTDVTETPVPTNPATGKPFEYAVQADTATLKDSTSETPLTYTIRIRGK
jgi:hypothetical protein